MISDPLSLSALIAAATALAFWLDSRFAPASKIGASLLVIVFGALLSNTGIVPRESPVYSAVEGPVTSLAIVFLLLSVSLADLKAAGPRMLRLFVVAAAGTAIGSLIGALILSGALGDLTWRLAGAFTGTYTGGGLNFAALGRALELPPAAFAASAAADNVTTALWMGITLAVPIRLLGGSAVTEDRVAAADTDGDEVHPFWGKVSVSLLDLVILSAVGLAVLLAARLITRAVGFFPEILWLTTIALVAAQLRWVRALQGAQQLGNLGLHFFFLVIGIRSLLGEMVRVGPEVFYYTLIVVAVHGSFLYLVGRALKESMPMIAVASQAAIGGPTTAMAVAISRGWLGLMLPGIAVGLLGYALGNYAGYGVASLVRLWLGG